MCTPKFAIRDKVFAKMRGYPPWPAQVEGVADATPCKLKYHVYFYGTRQIAVCREEDLCSYLENRENLGKARKHKSFNDAIIQMESELGLLPSPGIPIQNNEEQENPQQDRDLIVSCMRLEAHLLDILFGIQSSLALNHADPDTCLRYLGDLFVLDITPLMIKKHPEVVGALIKLQKYVGNTNNWDMTNEEVELFLSKAKAIQVKSKLIYDKIQSMFHIPYGKKFVDVFREEITKFQDCIRGMTSNEFFSLVQDPTEDLENTTEDVSCLL